MKLLQKSIWLLAAVGLLAVSCAKEQSETPSAVMKDLPSITASTTAKVATKVTVGECEGQEKLVNWDTGDAISVFYHNVANLKFALEGEGGSPSGVFNYESGNGLGLEFPQVYGVFPYARATSMADGVIYTDFPVEQTFTEKSFDPQSNLMVAVSRTPDLFFQHVGGFLLLNLFGEDVEVTKAELRGNDGEILGGPAEVYAYEDDTPGIWFDPETGSQTLTLVSDEPVAVHEGRDNPTEFWLVVPPTLFEEGFTVTVTDAEGGILVAEVTSEVEIERNTIFRMAPLCLKRVASEFSAEIAWTYAEDAEMDHEVYYEGADPLYAHTAVPLGVDAATVAKYGEEIDATVPESVTVGIVDPNTDEFMPAEGVTVSNIALKDGELVADVAGFAWDELYTVTVQYALNTCDLTLEGTLATVDRSREPIVLDKVNGYTFTLGEYDDETGYGYSGDPQGTGDGYYLWDGNDLGAEIFAAFQSAGLVTDEDWQDAESFAGAELGDNVYPADPASIPEGAEAYVGLSTGMYLYTTEAFTEAILTGDVFSSGTPSADNPRYYEGKTLYLCFTTYLGQEVQIPVAFNYEIPEVEPVILYCEDFEDNFVEERMPGWSFFDADGDDFNWEYWEDDNSTRYNHYSGIGFMSSASYDNPSYSALSPDNWAVTPAIQLSAVSNYLSFWVGAQDPSYAEEYYAVYITTDEQPSPDADGYTLLMGEILGTTTPFETHVNSNRYAYRYVVKIPAEFDGETVHLAFRHYNCTDMYRINLDDVYVTETRPVVGDQGSTPPSDPDPDPDPDPTIIYSTNFDANDQLDGWWGYDYDGDGYSWEVDSYNGYGESICLRSNSYIGGEALSPDNWLGSPEIELGSESYQLRFWAASYLSSWLDHYGVYIADVSDGTDLETLITGLVSTDPLFAEDADGEWHQVVIPIPDEFKGKTILLLFRHYNCTDEFALLIDNVEVVVDTGSSPSPAPAKRSYDAKKRVAPKLSAPVQKKDIPVSKTFPLPTWKK